MQPFFLNKWFLDYCKFLSNFQISEKVDLDNFCQCCHLFYGRMDFRDSYSFIPVFSEVTSKIFIFWRHLCSCALSRVTPWTVAHQARLSMELSRQKYWSGLPFPSPGHLKSFSKDWNCISCIAGRFFTCRAIWEGIWRSQLLETNVS